MSREVKTVVYGRVAGVLAPVALIATWLPVLATARPQVMQVIRGVRASSSLYRRLGL
jgi:hypothetical protein